MLIMYVCALRVRDGGSRCCWVSASLQKVNVFLYQLEMKQRYLVGKMNTPDERGDGAQEEVTMETLGEVTDWNHAKSIDLSAYLFPCFSQRLCFFVADTCIEKSLLLFRFTPCGVPSVDSDSSKKTDGTSVPFLRSSSISEGDFQASSSPASPTVSTAEGVQPTAVQDQNVCAHGKSGHKSSTESLSSQAAEPASPSTFPRKAPFSRSRLRLLSCRSIEEPHMTSSVKDRYPMIKHILNFIRDQALTTARCVTTTSLLCCDFFFSAV